jgi:hypothetical protein
MCVVPKRGRGQGARSLLTRAPQIAEIATSVRGDPLTPASFMVPFALVHFVTIGMVLLFSLVTRERGHGGSGGSSTDTSSTSRTRRSSTASSASASSDADVAGTSVSQRRSVRRASGGAGRHGARRATSLANGVSAPQNSSGRSDSERSERGGDGDHVASDHTIEMEQVV